MRDCDGESRYHCVVLHVHGIYGIQGVDRKDIVVVTKLEASEGG